MKLTIRFAIVGCGLISRLHLEAIRDIEDARLGGVYDANPDMARRIAEKWRTKAYDTYEDILTDTGIDAVCICTPSFLHAQLAGQAIRAGKHVLIEKPAALSVEACDRLIALGRQYHVQVGVVSQLRFSPSILQVKKAVDAGILGRITRADLYMKYYRNQEYYDQSNWRGTWEKDGGGALMNQGIHGVDLLLYLMGRVKDIYARYGTRVRDIEVEDTLSAVLTYDSGAIGVIEASTGDWPGMPRRLEINGEYGRIVLEEDVIAAFEVEGGKNYGMLEQQKRESATHKDPAYIDSVGHRRQIENFISAVRGDTELFVDAAQGRLAVELIRAAYQSQKEKRPVTLPRLSGKQDSPLGFVCG